MNGTNDKTSFKLSFLKAFAHSVQEEGRDKHNIFNVAYAVIAGSKFDYLETTIGFVGFDCRIYSVITRICLVHNKIHIVRRSLYNVSSLDSRWFPVVLDLNDPNCIDTLLNIVFDSYTISGFPRITPTIY